MARPSVVVDSWYADELVMRLPDASPADALLARLPVPVARLAARCGTLRAVALLVLARGALLVTTNPSPGARTLVTIEGVLGRRRLVLLEYIAHPPGSGSRTAPLRRLMFAVLRRVLLPRALVVAQVLTVAERRGCAESHGMPETRFHHIAWPARSTADVALFDRVSGGRRVLCSGRRVDWDTFARAATNAGWTVTAVCTAADAARVHRLLDPLGARVLTEVSQTEHAAEVRAATVYVVSVPETGASIGQVRMMNAADAGTPLVVSRVAGVADYVDETCAVLVEPGDPGELRVEVDALLADPDRQRALSDALFIRASGHTMPEYLDEIAALVTRHTPVDVDPQVNPPVSHRPSRARRAASARTPGGVTRRRQLLSMPPGERRRRGRRATDPVVLPSRVRFDRRSHPGGVDVLGVHVLALTTQQALDRVSSIIERGASGSVAFANAHLLTLASTRPEVRDALRRCALVLNDGEGTAWAARAKGSKFIENLNGTDFTPLLLERAAARGWRVALLGAAPGVAERAAVKLVQRLPKLQVCYAEQGFFDLAHAAQVAAHIRASRPQLLIVAMGNPRQELWVDEYLSATGANVGISVGAFLDFAAGDVARAPQWVRAAHLEWAFRLAREPRRLFARYVVGIPIFRHRVRRDVVDPLPSHPRRRTTDREDDAQNSAASDFQSERHRRT